VQFGGVGRVHGVIHPPDIFSTDLLNPVVPTTVQLISPGWATGLSAHFSGNYSEANAYLGIPLIAFLVFILIRFRRQPLVQLAVSVAVIMGILSLGPHLHLRGHDLGIPAPWHIATFLPLIGNILPSRMMVYVYLAAGTLLAFGVEQLWADRRHALFLVPTIGLIIVSLLPKLPLYSQQLPVPSYLESAAVRDIPSGTAVLSVPWPSAQALDPMNLQMLSDFHFRLLGGYFIGPDAGSQTRLREFASSVGQSTSVNAGLPVGDAQLADLRAELRTNGVGAVILGPVPDHATALNVLSRLIGSAPRVDGDIAVWLIPRPPSN
jgi:hypothetical protein